MMSENNSENQIKPLISIIIPFFNSEKFLREAIESVLNQSVNKWEMILINDGSSDKSLEIVSEFIKKYPNKIFLFNHKNNKNKGASASRNLGIAKAKGKFITFLDADDIYFPDSFERELKAFAENPEADAVCGTAECWFSWSDKTERREKDFTIDLILETEKLYNPPDLLIHNLVMGGRKPHPNCVMVKSEFAKKISIFEKNYRLSWEDHVAWAKLALNGKIFVLDAVLAKYRMYANSTYASETREGRDIASKTAFIDWLETYLVKQNIEDEKVWNSLHNFRRKADLDNKLSKLIQIYRKFMPLHLRYKIRDNLTKAKNLLSRSAHRHK